METLKEFNVQRLKDWNHFREDISKPHPNGLLCPKCKYELWDSTPGKILLSNPPQKNVHCPMCGFHGFRFV